MTKLTTLILKKEDIKVVLLPSKPGKALTKFDYFNLAMNK